ncbi:MAG: hypothetical protein K2O40_11100 [Lachnospiraceae bacterium]|nr:hypothetical protein [Lachnospiraceae bacterium]MDE7184993.1 hypothetical protein [Lachnospiraceae bacterium]
MSRIKKSQILKESETFLRFVIVLRIENIETVQFIWCDIGKLIEDNSDILFFGVALNVDDVGELSDYILQPHGIDFGTLCSSARLHFISPILVFCE